MRALCCDLALDSCNVIYYYYEKQLTYRQITSLEGNVGLKYIMMLRVYIPKIFLSFLSSKDFNYNVATRLGF